MPPASNLVVLAMLVGGCASFSPVTIARELGTVGWFEADSANRWNPVANGGCLASETTGDVIVLVHGAKGDGPEISALLPVLAGAKPAALLLYRWVPWDDRDAIARRFAVGFSHLLRCAPWADGRVLVVAHSAGGIVVGHGATRIDIPRRERTGPAVFLMTVAAPMAGMNDRQANDDGRAEVRFLLDWGTHIQKYPPAPTAMAVVHLRTQFPADAVMQPTPRHAPNDPTVGIPGARQLELPAGLSHDGALMYVAERLADGTWRSWFE